MKNACILQEASTIKIPYEQVNPIALKEPIAPHIAAAKEGKVFDKDQVLQHINIGLGYKAGFNDN